MPFERIAMAAHRRVRARRSRVAWIAVTALAAVSLIVFSLPALAQVPGEGGASLPLLIGQSAGSTSYSVPVQTLLFFTALSFL
ncbi:MAG: hypothetical protein ABI460_15000, partial [Caldimonas sp.]